jgi:hypothetical protein
VPLLATEAGGAAATVVPAGVLGGAAIYGWLGIRPGSTLNTSNVVGVLQERTTQEVKRIRPWIAGPLAAVGTAFTFSWVRRPAWTRHARVLARLGVAWLVVTLGGTVMGLVRPAVAGHRFLLFAAPLPALAGLGIAGVGWLFVRRPGLAWKMTGAAAMAGLVALVAAGGVSYFYLHTYPRTDPVYEQLRAAGVYAERYGGDRPVVFVLNRRGPSAAPSLKFRSYVVKGEMPARLVPRTLVYLGTPQDLEANRPTLFLPPTQPWQRSFNAVSQQTWSAVEPALRQGAIVLMVQRFALDQFKAAIATDPSRRVAPGVYLVRGPVRPLGTLPPPGRFDLVEGAIAAAGMFVILGLLGWGLGAAGLASSGPSAFDLALLAPAVGAGVAVVAGFLLAAGGLDPRGPAGIATLLALTCISALVGVGARAGTGPFGGLASRPASHERPPSLG